MLASDVATRATDILQDTTNVRWPSDELLRWITDGQREVVAFKPEANVTNATLTLVPNQSKQTIPTLATQLIAIYRNLGVDGLTAGRAIRVIDREVLDASIPAWHASDASSEVKHYTFDSRDPKTFYVYPRPNAAIKVEGAYAVTPAVVTALGQALELNDVYLNVLVDYVLYRAYSKDAGYAGNANRAVAHYQAFQQSLGLKTQIERAASPVQNSPLNPNVVKA